MSLKNKIKRIVEIITEKENKYKRPKKGEKRIDHSDEKHKAIEKAWKN